MITAISYIAAWYIRIVLFAEPGKGVLPMETYFTALYFIVPGYLLLYWMANLYRSKRFSSPWKEAVDVIRANIFGLVLFFVVLYIVNEPNFSRSMIFVFFGINIFIMLLVRKILRVALRSIRKRGYNIKHILLVGYSRATEAYIDRLLANPEWGYMVCGILDDKIPAGTLYRDIKVLGGIGNLQYILPENKMDEIGITLSLADYDKLEESLREIRRSYQVYSRLQFRHSFESLYRRSAGLTGYQYQTRSFNQYLQSDAEKNRGYYRFPCGNRDFFTDYAGFRHCHQSRGRRRGNL